MNRYRDLAILTRKANSGDFWELNICRAAGLAIVAIVWGMCLLVKAVFFA